MLNFKFRYCLKEVLGRRNRFLLMLSGTALGVAFWLCLNALAGAYDQAAIAPLQAIGADLTVQKSGGTVPDKFEGAVIPCASDIISGLAVARIQAIPGVKEVTPTLLMWVFGTDQKNSNDFKMVLGIDPKAKSGLDKLKSGLKAGRFFEAGDLNTALIDESYGITKKLKPGDALEVAGNRLEIVGVIATPSTNLLGSTNIFIPLGKAREIAAHAPQIHGFGKKDVNLLFIKADPTRVAIVQAAITKIIPGSTVSSPSRFLNLMGGLAAVAKHLAWLGSLIGILIAVAIVARTSASGILERRRDLAVMKAVGWTASDIRYQVLCENLFAGFLGGAVGLIVSFFFTMILQGQKVAIPLPWELNPYPHFYLTNNTAKFLEVPLPIHLSWSSIIFALVLGLGIALLTTLLILRYLGQIKPAEVLRNE
jgi:ABC-type antimicrobial peptide transport system permease subunit